MLGLVEPARLGPAGGRLMSAGSHGRGPFLCRFMDAGNTETLRALSEPASKKRQGTKSREVR
jgi:hypothetical protein